jgi:alkanesulfonate monooxygenase SsuD/methylene tetrahydromethanopterin reductase-like flavin-dependent oxidoreductase (luciferase family)
MDTTKQPLDRPTHTASTRSLRPRGARPAAAVIAARRADCRDSGSLGGSPERDGFASGWFANIFGFDAILACALCGRETSRIELGTAVVPTYPRHPMAMAQEAMSASAACRGRFTLGIGLSHRVQATLAVAGATPPPILIAALAPKMLALAGSQADGTITWMTGPKTLREHTLSRINEAAARADRPAPRVVAGLPIAVTDDVAAARETAGRAFQVYGYLPSYRAMLDREGAAGPADVAIAGDEDAVGEQIAGLGEIGVTDLLAVPYPVGDDAPGSLARTRRLLVALAGRA